MASKGRSWSRPSSDLEDRRTAEIRGELESASPKGKYGRPLRDSPPRRGRWRQRDAAGRDRLPISKTDVLLKYAANWNQQAPKGNMVGHSGIAHRAEVDGVKGTQLVETVFRSRRQTYC